MLLFKDRIYEKNNYNKNYLLYFFHNIIIDYILIIIKLYD